MQADLLSFKHYSSAQISGLLSLASRIKQQPQDFSQVLQGKSVVGWFEKPSLRTRVSFDIGINKLGGHFVYLDAQSNKLQGRESATDMGANLACWADAIVARVFDHQSLEQMSEASSKPVINALCDRYHPCQALADYLTVKEVYGNMTQTKLAYIGDGNNVCHSLMIIAAQLNLPLVVVTPPGYEPNAEIADWCRKQHTDGNQLVISNQLEASIGAQVLYTDTWQSMGNGGDKQKIIADFDGYQINSDLLQLSGAQHVMHCQPAYPDVEISKALINSKHSLLMQQAENRMHAQNAILAYLVGDQGL